MLALGGNIQETTLDLLIQENILLLMGLKK